MTLLGAITIDIPVAFTRRGYNVSLRGSFNDSIGFNELREMFAKAEFGGAVHAVPGERPFSEDLTDASVNTQYATFTHGTDGKVQDGWYLLRPGHAFVEDHTPEGHSYVFMIRLFWIGTTAIYQDGYKLKSLASVTNDWGI